MLDSFFRAVSSTSDRAVSLLDRGILTTESVVQEVVSVGRSTLSHVNQSDAQAASAVVSKAVHDVGQPVMNMVKDVDRAAQSVTQGSNQGQIVFQVMGLGALGWMGWNLFAYVNPKRHQRIRNEMVRTTKRLRANW